MLPTLLAAVLAAADPSPFSDALPPDVFRRNASFSLELRDQAGIESTCNAFFGPAPEGFEIGGCQTGRRIIAPNPCLYAQTESYARLLCHELGHLNGWSAMHPLEQAEAPGPSPEPQGASVRPRAP